MVQMSEYVDLRFHLKAEVEEGEPDYLRLASVERIGLSDGAVDALDSIGESIAQMDSHQLFMVNAVSAVLVYGGIEEVE